MDIREKIIQKVIQGLEGRVEETVIDTIQDILIIELNHYEVTERCTEVALLDNSAEKMLKKFLATKRVEGIAESTLQRYANENLKLIRFLGKPVFEITPYDIRFYLSYRRERSEVKLSNRTLDGIRRCYSSFFGWLSTEGLIQHNPCASIKQIKYRKKVKRPYTAAEMEKLRMACENTRDLALLDFLYCTGCRVSEVAKLNVEDIDFERMECTVLGKGNKERTVYLSEVAGMHLKNYLSERKDQKEALFAGKGTERLGKNGIEALLKRLGAKADVSDVHPHRYRRTLATNLLDRGMNIQDVAAILGHADLKTTQIYCYISQKNVKTAYNKYAV
ncbi:MAG: tyrosine-type recombinase/integrase [Lachnospiraceae bacterium]|nr:tyrosine-type recombinase/integrase [Lachnospiraceae bacterium]